MLLKSTMVVNSAISISHHSGTLCGSKWMKLPLFVRTLKIRGDPNIITQWPTEETRNLFRTRDTWKMLLCGTQKISTAEIIQHMRRPQAWHIYNVMYKLDLSSVVKSLMLIDNTNRLLTYLACSNHLCPLLLIHALTK